MIICLHFNFGAFRKAVDEELFNEGIAMKLGIRVPSFSLGSQTATLEEMGSYLRRAEDLGFYSATCIDHLLTVPPATVRTWLEPMVLMGALAGVTKKIKLGPLGLPCWITGGVLSQ